MGSRRKAFIMVREAPWYRRDAFHTGLAAAGFESLLRTPDNVTRGDVLVVWNRYAHYHEMALQFERAGGIVLVAENGYIGNGGSAPKFDVHPHGPTPNDFYALSLHGHNGSGQWKPGDGSRWADIGIELAPWRADAAAGHILVCGQRGIGHPTMASPPDFNERTVAAIRRHTTREVRLRPHPGNKAPARPLEADLAGAHSCVIWSSGSGVRALTLGIPVFYTAPKWICSGGARRFDASQVESPLMDDGARLAALQSMAWAQWRCSELFSGAPFVHLVGRGDAA